MYLFLLTYYVSHMSWSLIRCLSRQFRSQLPIGSTLVPKPCKWAFSSPMYFHSLPPPRWFMAHNVTFQCVWPSFRPTSHFTPTLTRSDLIRWLGQKTEPIVNRCSSAYSRVFACSSCAVFNCIPENKLLQWLMFLAILPNVSLIFGSFYCSFYGLAAAGCWKGLILFLKIFGYPHDFPRK